MRSRAESPIIDELLHKAKLSKAEAHVMLVGRRARIYGTYMDRMAEHTLTQKTVDVPIAVRALLHTAIAFGTSDIRYHAENTEHALSDNALEEHQVNVGNGKDVLVGPDAAITRAHGKAQTELGSRMLDEASPEVRDAIPLLHYGTLFRGGGDKPESIDYNNLDTLSHLSLCNLAIGQIAGGVTEFLANSSGRLQVIDVGAGRYGHTTEAVASYIANAKNRPQIAYTVIETASEFFLDLEKHMRDKSVEKSLGLKFRPNPKSDESISEFGAFTTINADAVKAIQKLNTSEEVGDKDLALLIANYSFHCLSQTSKDKILEKLSELENAILVVGDVVESTAKYNLEFSGLAANIGYDAGNQKFTKGLRKYGFGIVDQRKFKPKALEKRANDRLVREQRRNGPRLWIAYKGELAEKALELKAVA